MDSDWAGDATGLHSTSGYIFLYGQTAISWKTKKQSLIAVSTTEAEYIEASEASKEAIWLRRILHELLSCLTNPKPGKSALPNASITLHIDNQATIKLIQNPRFHERTKHIEIKHHYIRETFENGEIDLQHVSTNNYLADIMTKSLPATTIWPHLHHIGLQEWTS